MASNAAYVLKAHGIIESGWLQDCFRLFKERQVCIRKLLLMKDGHPEHFSMLELHFTLPPIDPAAGQPHPFLGLLNGQLQQQPDAEPSLVLLSAP